MDLGYKIQTVSDHVAKFRGNRLRDFGERVAQEKRKKISLAFYKSSRTTVTGGLTGRTTFAALGDPFPGLKIVIVSKYLTRMIKVSEMKVSLREHCTWSGTGTGNGKKDES